MGRHKLFNVPKIMRISPRPCKVDNSSPDHLILSRYFLMKTQSASATERYLAWRGLWWWEVAHRKLMTIARAPEMCPGISTGSSGRSTVVRISRNPTSNEELCV